MFPGHSLSKGARLCALVLLIALMQPAMGRAAANVIVGGTPIVDGEAAAAHDLTVLNEHLAFGLAVESGAPYGVPRGAIIDVAPVVDGKPGRDRVVFADFIPNNWSAWPNTYQKVEIVERGPAQVVVRATRDWGSVTIATTYTLRAGADRIEIRTTMTNTGNAPLPDLLSGHTLWPSAGYFFGIPGLGDLKEGVPTGALADRVVAYDEDWAITLHAPYVDYVGSGSLDLFQKHTLEAGETRTLDAWLQVGPRGDLGPTLAAEIERKHLDSGTVHGVVTSRDGRAVDKPVVVIRKRGTAYGWVYGRGGRYVAELPVGEYELYATAKGYSQSQPTVVKLGAGDDAALYFGELEPPGSVDFEIVDARTGDGLDARIVITQGQKQLVEFLGRKTFFTELDRKGRIAEAMAPGSYEFTVSAGGAFVAASRSVPLDVRAGQTTRSKVSITRLFDPRASGWYSADLHHHADQAEGVTPPEFVARSQLAAALDLLFVSDHDSTANHAPMQRLADRRGVPFIPSIELSPSWGHFNAWPLRPAERLAIDTSTATVDAVLAEARRQGAIVIQSNHPFIPYGYFASLAANVALGGFNPGFDLLEINADRPDDDDKVLRTLWDFWNSGHRYHLSGGTDVHDVWNFESGRTRTFAHVEGLLTPRTFADAVRAGHAYVSSGPLIFPAVMFGSELKVKRGASFALAFELKSVAGLKQAELVGAGTLVTTRSFRNAPREAGVEFTLTADRDTWYALDVEDTSGGKAYSNPIWIDVVELSDQDAVALRWGLTP
jgi:Carboxypeptidase regulatory-like domain